MPSCGGYLVSPASAALLAASMACVGVGKSGSPEERPTIFTPWARNSRTLRVMAAEADTLMLRRRSATSNIALFSCWRSDNRASTWEFTRRIENCPGLSIVGIILFRFYNLTVTLECTAAMGSGDETDTGDHHTFDAWHDMRLRVSADCLTTATTTSSSPSAYRQ